MTKICLLTDQPILCPEDDVQIGDYHFHLRALAKNYVLSGSLEDPCTRLELQLEVKDRVQAEASKHIIRGLLVSTMSITGTEVSLNGLESVGSAILTILSKFGPIPEIVASFDVRMNNISLYSFDLSTDLSSYLSPKEEYVISVHRGVPATNVYKMYLHTSKLDSSTIADVIMVELTYGTMRKI